MNKLSQHITYLVLLLAQHFDPYASYQGDDYNAAG